MDEADDLFLEDQHPDSRRYAIFETNDNGGWLYLTAPDEGRPEADALVFSSGYLCTIEEAQQAAESGEAPPLAEPFASDEAILELANPDALALAWSEDGESIAVLYGERPLAMIVDGPRRSYSRAIGLKGPYGLPWDDEVYLATFGD